jgi:hypothetical protein
MYAWIGPNGFVSSFQNPFVPGASAQNAGAYSVVITGSGCPTLPGTVNVTIIPAPALPLFAGDSIYCEGDTIQLNVTNADTLLWSGPDNFQSTAAAISIFDAGAINSGSYTVVVSSSGCTSSASINITVNPVPVADIIC